MKRILMLILCLMLCAAALAENYAVYYIGTEEAPGYALLIGEDGAPLTPIETYSNIYAITPEDCAPEDVLYAATPVSLPASEANRVADDGFEWYFDVRAALMDANGAPLTDFDYLSLSCPAPGEVVFLQTDGRAGVMNASGKILVPAEYVEICPTGEGGRLALRLTGAVPQYDVSYPIVFIDADGTPRDTGLHAPRGNLQAGSGGICAASSVDEYGGRTVYFDANGEALFGRGFDSGDRFIENHAVVEVDGRYGLIGRDGRYAAPAVFDYISNGDTARGALYFAHLDDTVTVYSADTGRAIMEFGFENADYVIAWMANPWLFLISTGQETRLYALDGALLYSTSGDLNLDAYYPLCDAMPERFVETAGEWPRVSARLIDCSGAQAGGSFQQLNPALWRDGHGLYVTARFRIRRDEYGDDIADWSSWRCGLCDERGDAVLDAKYDIIEVLSGDRFWVRQGSRTGLIDRDGRWYYAISDYAQLMD